MTSEQWPIFLGSFHRLNCISENSFHRKSTEQLSSGTKTSSNAETEKPKIRPKRKLMENASQEAVAGLESPAKRSIR